MPLKSFMQQTERSWGLLTDGWRWRLYHAGVMGLYEDSLEIAPESVLEDRGEAGRTLGAAGVRQAVHAPQFQRKLLVNPLWDDQSQLEGP